MTPERERNEEKFVQLIVEDVLERVVKTHRVLFPQKLVGMESQVENMLEILDLDDTNGVRIIGIVGMGGLGKTTLAKCIYNQVISNFRGQCFLANIREASAQPNGIISLQKQLIRDVSRVEKDIHTPDEGKKVIEQSLCHRRVLTVLDDIDDPKQLEALAGNKNWFGPGSRIIVTTRDQRTLNLHADQEGLFIFHPNVLSKVDSIKLLSFYAFNKDYPPGDYAPLSEKVIEKVECLPLEILVIGSDLFGCSLSEWKDMLDSLDVTANDVESRLRIVFDGLRDEHKYIFLVIASNFLGKRGLYVIYCLEELGFTKPIPAIEALQLESFLEIDESTGYFLMHDLIKDMSKTILDEHNKLPAWSSQQQNNNNQIYHASDQSKLTGSLDGQNGSKIDPACFNIISDRAFLSVDQNSSVENLDHLPVNLKWLECRNCPISELPNKWELNGLTILDLQHSYVLNKLCLISKSLRVLDLTDCKKLKKLPDFALIPRLTELRLHGCIELEELPNSLCELCVLRVLDVSNCDNLRSLPENLGQLKSLEKLWLNGTGTTSLHSLNGCENLRVLDVTNCKELKELPNFAEIRNLSELIMRDCIGLKELPDNLCSLSSLKVLDLSGCKNLSWLPKNLGNLESLEKLCLMGTAIESLFSFSGFKSLRVLDLTDCKKLKELLNFAIVPSVKELILHGCFGFTQLPDNLCHLSLLEVLDLSDCENLSSLPDNLGKLESLEKLWLNGTAIQSLFSLNDLKNLQLLNLTDCKKLKELPNFDRTPHLSELIFHGCIRLRELPDSLCDLSALEVLDLSYCENLRSLPKNLGKLGSLEKLLLNGTGMGSFPPIISLKKLQRLSIMCGFETLYQLPYSIALHELDLTDLPNWEGWPAHVDIGNQMLSLQHLVIHGCPKIKVLPHFPRLESLKIRKCRELEVLPYVDTLEEVDVYACKGLRTLWKGGPCNGSRSNLRILKLVNCPSLELKWHDLAWLSMLLELMIPMSSSMFHLPEDVDATNLGRVLHGIKKLRLSGEKLEDGRECLPGWLRLLMQLEDLCIVEFRHLRHLSGSWQCLTQLTSLEIANCPKIKTLSPHDGEEFRAVVKKLRGVEAIPGLVSVTLRFLEELTSIPEQMVSFSTLKQLEIQSCPRLAFLPSKWEKHVNIQRS